MFVNKSSGFRKTNQATRNSLAFADYIVEHGATVRQTAHAFSVSKSLVHKEIKENIELFGAELAERVRSVLDRNLNERARRGGLAYAAKVAMHHGKGKKYL